MPLDVMQPESYDAPELTLPRIAWTPESADLHVNLVVLETGEAIGEHVNESLDVLLTCLWGSGHLLVEGETIQLVPGTVAVIPKGSTRSIVADNNGLRYTTCHQKRGGIMPTVKHRP